MKKILVKIYNEKDQFIMDWDKAIFQGFSKEINAGPGECVLRLAEKFDYGGGELKLGNFVRVLVSDKETISLPDGYLVIYSGYISMIETWDDGKKEGIDVHLLGDYTKLGVDILKNGAQTTLYSDSTAGLTVTSPGDAADVGLMARAVITRYRAETVNPRINFSPESIPLASSTQSYFFEQKTYREALEKLLTIAPAGYYYYINENGVLTFKQKSTTVKHRFEFQKHISSIRVQKGIEKMKNCVLLWNGAADPDDIYKKYEDTASIIKYGRRTELKEDYGIVDAAGADAIGASFISQNKLPESRIIVDIVDNSADSVNGYDIESIDPGDTCSFVGIDDFLADIFYSNMIITKVDYSLDKATVTIENYGSGILDWQEKTNRELNDLRRKGGLPESYS